MLQVTGIVVLIFELLMICIFCYLSYRNKVVFTKNNFIYFVPMLLITMVLYLVGQIYSKDYFDFFILTESIRYAFKVFAFETKPDFVTPAIDDNFFFAAAYYGAVVLGGLTLVASVLSIVKIATVNLFKVGHRKVAGTDIAVGFDKNAISYAKNNKNTILWVDSTIKELSKEEKTKLYASKIAYINRPFNYRNLKSYLTKFKGIYHFVIFNETNNTRYTKYVDIFTDERIKVPATVFLHIEAPNEYINFVNGQMSKRAVNTKYNLVASCFNVHELVARKFVLENTFIDYLKEGSIENGILKNDINVFFIGFGKTNFSIFNACLLNNQFVKIENNKLVNKPVNYYLYDMDDKAFNKELVARLHIDYDKRKIDKDIPPIEKICNLDFKKINIKSDCFIDEIEAKMQEGSHNIFFIAFSDGVENASYAEVLEHYFFKKNIHIYYNIDHKYEILSSEFSSDITAFGYKNDILTHDVIANDSLSRIASNVNDTYNKLSIDKLAAWTKLPIIEKYSNVYSAINLKFKLKMMGLDYKDILANELSKEEYYKVLFSNRDQEEIDRLLKYEDYQEYFNINLRTVMAFQEHLRWVTYYYVNNFDQMDSTDFEMNGDKLVIKDLNKKRHGCITSYYGLDTLYKRMVEIYKDKGFEKTLLDVESYKYDYMLLDNLYTNI